MRSMQKQKTREGDAQVERCQYQRVGHSGIEIHITMMNRASDHQPVTLVTQLLKYRVSDNVGLVKSFLSVLHRALERERHFALMEEAVPTKARSVIVAVKILDPTHASLRSNSGS